MKTIREYSAPVLEAWATWQVLRQLGFSADNIYWVVVLTGNAVPRAGLALNVRLATQDKELLVTCSGTLERADVDALLQESAAFMERVNEKAFDEDVMRAILHDSFVWKNKASLLMILLSKGFVLPRSVS